VGSMRLQRRRPALPRRWQQGAGPDGIDACRHMPA